MPDILYAVNQEQIVTTNAWAFLHWLRSARGISLPDWAALQRWSTTDGAEFASAIAEFAGLPAEPVLLARHKGGQEALVMRRQGGERIAFSRDDLLCMSWPDSSRPSAPAPSLPKDIASPLTRPWPPVTLIRPLADLLLHADLRPDDRLLVVGSAAWPWLAVLLEGTTVILAATTPPSLLATAAEEGATVIVTPAQTLAEVAFQRARHRPNLACLRTIIAVGGPLSPEGRSRVYTWIKPDLMLLARTGDTLWGNPLEPVYARPAATPGFFTPPASAPATP
jgi:hypothetical protein